MHDNESGDRYVPPDVPTIKSQINDPIKFYAICAVVGAPLVLVLDVIFIRGYFLQYGIATLCVLVFVVSFIVLFVRAGKNPSPPREGWDDGTEL